MEFPDFTKFQVSNGHGSIITLFPLNLLFNHLHPRGSTLNIPLAVGLPEVPPSPLLIIRITPTMSQVQIESIAPNFGFDQMSHREVAMVLSTLDADECLLLSHAWNFKHNVLGPNAKQYKDLFKAQAEDLACLMHKVAKAIRNEGARVPTIMEKMKMARVQGLPEGKWMEPHAMLGNLLEGHQTVIRALYKDIERVRKVKEFDVEDLLEKAIRAHKELAKKLRIHMEQQG